MLTPLQENSYSSRIHKNPHKYAHELKKAVFTLLLKLKSKNEKTSAYSASFKVFLTAGKAKCSGSSQNLY